MLTVNLFIKSCTKTVPKFYLFQICQGAVKWVCLLLKKVANYKDYFPRKCYSFPPSQIASTKVGLQPWCNELQKFWKEEISLTATLTLFQFWAKGKFFIFSFHAVVENWNVCCVFWPNILVVNMICTLSYSCWPPHSKILPPPTGENMGHFCLILKEQASFLFL